ncbi:MAG: hypothetical protein AVO34_02665 [Firmicutes bacterium ML8_F2]|nr:MAG: hypothetical protein AVO34_02665 [Firmicutes bacterium ML8_F2]
MRLTEAVIIAFAFFSADNQAGLLKHLQVAGNFVLTLFERIHYFTNANLRFYPVRQSQNTNAVF